MTNKWLRQAVLQFIAVSLIAACSSGGGGGGGEAVTTSATTTTTVTAPNAPTGLAATVASTSAINLSWTDASDNEDAFVVERGTDGTTFTAIKTTASTPTSYSDTGLAASTKYYYRVKATNSAGESTYSTTANATTQSPALAPLVLAPRYSIAPNWNDYVRSSNTAATCAGTENGGYTACIHGGENLIVSVTGKTSCTGLTATDSLGAFTWSCDGSTNPVRMVTKALNSGKHLSDLIDFTSGAWKQNAVTVFDGGTAYNSTSAASWWSNPVVQNNAGGSLGTAGTVYIVTSSQSTSYIIDASRIGFVIKPGSTVTSTAPTVISAASRTGLWIEGSIDAASSGGQGLYLSAVAFSMIRNVATINAVNGILLTSSNNNRIMDATSVNNANAGISLSSSNGNQIAGGSLSNNGADGVIVAGNSNALTSVTANSNQAMGFFINGNNNQVISVTAANNGNVGLFLNTASSTFIFNALSVSNNWAVGIVGGLGISSGSKNTIANFASAENQNIPAIHSSSSSNNYYTGVLKVGSTVAPCWESGGISPGINHLTCAASGSSNATVSTGVTLTSSFGAKVTTNDTSNASDINGVRDVGFILDWTTFENRWRGWGLDGSSFPSANNQGRCTAGTCRIWDWSLKTADTAVRGVLTIPSGSDFIDHIWTAANQPACSEITGAVWNSGATTCFSEVLRNAVEIIGDGIGNDNGLCESNETCLYTPNIGSYQGHGSLISAGTFTNGLVSNVTLMKYSTNGY